MSGFLLAVIVATMITFALSRAAGDPRLLYAGAEGYGMTPEHWDLIGKELGLDKPVVVQYFVWMGNILRGDFGDSLAGKQPVTKIVGEKIPATLQLGLTGWALATVVGVPLGADSFEQYKATVIDQATTRVLALINICRSGMVTHSEQDVTQLQAAPCAMVMKQFPDQIVRIKAAHFDGPGYYGKE
jgi:peptide/nickel transport system permease protein